ncbi:MAG: hypothetical protein AB4057_11165 [Crocosphaera sp.]
MTINEIPQLVFSIIVLLFLLKLLIDFGKIIFKYNVKENRNKLSIEFHKVHRYPDTDEIDFINAVVYTGFSSKEELLIFIEENIIIRDYDYFISKEVIDVNSIEEQE